MLMNKFPIFMIIIWNSSVVLTRKEEILNFFKRIEGKYILSGSFGGFNGVSSSLGFSSDEADGIYNMTKKYPAVYGLDCGQGWATTKPGEEADLVDCYHKDLLSYGKKGGIVTLNHVLPNPILPGNIPREDQMVGYNTSITNEEYRRLLTKGTPERFRLLSLYNKIAEGIATYSAEGITVLYRPYQEMNGKIFWWGNTDNQIKDLERMELFKIFWKDLHDYLTEEKELKNIIWIYAPLSSLPFKLDFYPGDAYVDMVGIDVYLNDFNQVKGYDEMLSLGKPLAFPEVGPMHGTFDWLPLGKLNYTHMIEVINRRFPKVIYFLAWNEIWSPLNNLNAYEAFNNPRVLNLGDI